MRNPESVSNLLQGFAPIVDERSSVLILGSMPGAASIRAGEYYAHPRNSFWWIFGQLVGAGPELPYEQRIALLRKHGIALWDVLARCERPGSLDADIDESTAEANDFAAFYRQYPRIWRVYFNGSKARQTYQQRVLPVLQGTDAHIEYHRLPSTSPAHASRPEADKLEAWRVVLGGP